MATYLDRAFADHVNDRARRGAFTLPATAFKAIAVSSM